MALECYGIYIYDKVLQSSFPTWVRIYYLPPNTLVFTTSVDTFEILLHFNSNFINSDEGPHLFVRNKESLTHMEIFLDFCLSSFPWFGSSHLVKVVYVMSSLCL